jgi:predicted permease
VTLGFSLPHAIRQLRKSPGFTAAAVLSLALGIGANTAILTLIESTILRPIAVKHPERLRLLTWKEQRGGWVPPNFGYRSPAFGTFYEQRDTPDGGLMHTDFTPRMYQSFVRDSRVFESLFAFKELGRVTAAVDGNAEPVNCFLVSGEFYRGMEITPVIGRAIGPEDDVPAAGAPVAMISYGYWTRRFGRNRLVIGKRITLNGVPVTIIGVNPEYFSGVEPGARFEIWAPLNLPPAVYGRLQHGAEFLGRSEVSFLDEEDAWGIPMMGRLQRGMTDSMAQSALDVLFQRQVDANPGPLASFLKEPAKRPRFLLQSAARGVDYLTERYNRLLVTVLALAGLVLLIACANVANLLLAKSAVRQREISVRLALGASRWQIARQLLAEGLLLAAMAGVAGVIFGCWTRNGIPALLATPWRPSPFETAFDPKALLISIGITLFTGVLFSLAPIWQSRRVELNEALKDGSLAKTGLSKLRVGRMLVVLQAALSVILLMGAGLCVKTFMNLRRMPLGFRPEGVLLFSVDPPRRSYPAGRMEGLLQQLQQRFGSIAGVVDATFSGGRGYAPVTVGERKQATYAASLDVGSHFFETMGVRIVNGRAIGGQDRGKGVPAAVVNQEFARRFFPSKNPLGETFRVRNETTYQIVGVCADWRADQFRDPVRATFYGAWMEAPQAGSIDFEIKTEGEQAGIERKIREAVRATDPALAIFDVHTEMEQIANALSQERLLAALATVFGGLALLLASIGMYGVMAYTVARRTNEIGIRVALGAQPARVARMVLRETLLLGAAGVAIGIPAVLAAGPVLDHFVAEGERKGFAYGVQPNDPALLALATVVLGAAVFSAGYFPARRAARIDPMAALRHE